MDGVRLAASTGEVNTPPSSAKMQSLFKPEGNVPRSLRIRIYTGGVLRHPKHILVAIHIYVQRQGYACFENGHGAGIAPAMNFRMAIRKGIPGCVAMIAGGIINDLPLGIRIRGIPTII